MNDRRWHQLTPTLWEYDITPHHSCLPLAPPPAVELCARRGKGGQNVAFWASPEGDESPDGEYPFGPFATLEDAQRAALAVTV